MTSHLFQSLGGASLSRSSRLTLCKPLSVGYSHRRYLLKCHRTLGPQSNKSITCKWSLQAMPVQLAQEDDQIIPYGYLWYETMILLRPDMDEEARDLELAKFEAYLQKEGAVNIDVLVRANSQALAYPIKGYWDGMYVLYTYAASPRTAQGVQKLLSAPAVGSEINILRHMTFKQ